MRRSEKGGLYDFFRRRVQFPLCDARGRVLGFGGRAVGADQKPKYVNSTDNVVYHKGRHLFAADLARTAAAKAGQVVLCEGYTDVIALHQAGLRNTVGLMGTALTEDQVGELARLAPVVLLALDADSAGQEAMLRAAKVAAGRRLELRVVVLPAGQDPADLLLSRGRRTACASASPASVPFVRFRVERVLGHGGPRRAPRARTARSRRCGRCSGTLPASALRDELLAIASDRLDVVPAKLAEWLAQPAQRAAPAPRVAPPRRSPRAAPRARAARRARSSARRRASSARCSCSAWRCRRRDARCSSGLDLEQAFQTPALRRAAALLRDHLGEQLRAPDGDDELARVLAELQVRAARATATRAALEAERLRLELATLERQIATARAGGEGNVVELARRREELQSAMEHELAETLAQTKHGD